jgi:3-oxoadipate enol-lactonase
MSSIELASGNCLGVAQCGSGGVPIVFLHGVGSDKSVWAPQLDAFGRSRRAIAFDYPGYGDSSPAGDFASRDGFAAAIWQALDTLAVERAHLCGLSLGGVVAIAMHEAAPHRCASLILADSFAVHPEGQAIFDRSIAASRNGTMRELAEARVDMLLAPGAAAHLREEVMEAMSRIDPEGYRIGAEAVWLADQRERARRIGVPTLVLVGAEDRITPPELSEQLAALVPGARLQTVSGAGHLANLEQPERFNAAAAAFVGAVEAA